MFLGLGYACVVALAINIGMHLGWIGPHLPLLSGAGTRWKLTLGAAACFVGAWYMERLIGARKT